MKPLLFIGITTGTIYASLRWEVVGYLIVGMLTFCAAFTILYSIYRHLHANRLL